MNSATWTLFLAMLVHASSALNETCPRSGSLSAPSRNEIDENTVCGKLYAKSACCSNDTVHKIQNADEVFLNKGIFVLSKPSKECETALKQIACLFECSPNFGILGSLTSPIRDVPICEDSCKRLYASCKNDETCTDDWSKAFDGLQFDCLNYSKEMYPRAPVWQKFNNSEELFCSKIKGDGFTKMAAPKESCFDVEHGTWEKGGEPSRGASGNHHTALAVIGVIVGAILICLALFYVVTYMMKKHRLTRGI